MSAYDIIPCSKVVDTVEANSAEDAMDSFVLHMDFDMNAYFKAVPHEENNELTVVAQNDNGVIFKSNKLPSIFNVYILRTQYFKNGTCRWKIGIEHEHSISKHFIIDSVVGSKEDAINVLKKLLS
jgi:hypothetical protein